MKITNGNAPTSLKLRTIQSFKSGEAFRIGSDLFLILEMGGEKHSASFQSMYISLVENCRRDPCAIPVDLELIYTDKKS